MRSKGWYFLWYILSSPDYWDFWLCHLTWAKVVLGLSVGPWGCGFSWIVQSLRKELTPAWGAPQNVGVSGGTYPKLHRTAPYCVEMGQMWNRYCRNMQNSGDALNTTHKRQSNVWPGKYPLLCVMDAVGFHLGINWCGRATWRIWEDICILRDFNLQPILHSGEHYMRSLLVRGCHKKNMFEIVLKWPRHPNPVLDTR